VVALAIADGFGSLRSKIPRTLTATHPLIPKTQKARVQSLNMADWYSSTTSSETKQEAKTSDLPFVSRRSPFLCRKGCVASSQPLASTIGLQILREGGNAADAAIAVAAALAVTEPCSTGLGGDMFALYYDAATKKVSAVNGSGKSPSALTRDVVVSSCGNTNGEIATSKFIMSPHAITVPGAAKGWHDVFQKFGSQAKSFAELLEPAAQLAEEGFPVSPITANAWQSGMDGIRKWKTNHEDHEVMPLSINGDAPQVGEIFVNKDMASVLRELGAKGPSEGFYKGFPGKAIAEAVQKNGGVMSEEDLASHETTFPEAICAKYRDVQLWQVPPNGQGIAGLIALTGLQELEEAGALPKTAMESPRSVEALHAQMEMMRLGFADIREHVADPDHMKVSNEQLLDKKRIGERANRLFDPKRAVVKGTPDVSSCTVSFQVVDKDGNAISFVNSNFMGFGTGLVPKGCGFSLQNRGFGFSLEPDHPNALGPSKRPYHTIIPGMLTHADTNELYATISNMGGNMQPQGHMQLTVALIAAGVDPQVAVDMPRFCIADGSQDGVSMLEDGISLPVMQELSQMGHSIHGPVTGHSRSLFGRAQIIKRDRITGVLWAGSDGRADGCAMGY